MAKSSVAMGPLSLKRPLAFAVAVMVMGAACTASKYQYVDVSSKPAEAIQTISETAKRAGMCTLDGRGRHENSVRTIAQRNESEAEVSIKPLNCEKLHSDAEALAVEHPDQPAPLPWDAIVRVWLRELPPESTLHLNLSTFEAYPHKEGSRILANSTSKLTLDKALMGQPLRSMSGIATQESFLWDLTTSFGMGIGHYASVHNDTMAHIGWRFGSWGGEGRTTRHTLGLMLGAGTNVETLLSSADTRVGLRTGIALVYDRGQTTMLVPGKRLATGRRLRSRVAFDSIVGGGGLGLDLTVSTEFAGVPAFLEHGNVGGYLRVGYRNGSADEAQVSAGLNLGALPTGVVLGALFLAGAAVALGEADWPSFCFRCDENGVSNP